MGFFGACCNWCCYCFRIEVEHEGLVRQVECKMHPLRSRKWKWKLELQLQPAGVSHRAVHPVAVWVVQ